MSMRCKQCGESFPKNQPFDVFELRRHKMASRYSSDEVVIITV